MIKFNVYNSYTYVKCTDNDSISPIKKYCTHMVKKFISVYKDDFGNILPAFRYKKLSPSERYKFHLTTEFKMDEISYFYEKYQSFPTGWMFNICNLLDLQRIKYTINDKRVPYTLKPISDTLPSLRYYQEEGVNLALEAERGIIKHPTGSGKTLVITRLCSSLRLPTLILVPNLILLTQTADFLKKYLPEHLVGKIGEAEWSPRLFTVATAQTLWARMKEESEEYLKTIAVLIGDECHKINKNQEHLPNTFFRISMKCHHAYYRYGLTATPGEPGTLQRKLLEGVTGDLIHDVPIQELVDKNYLTNAKIIIKKINIKSSYDKNWRRAYENNLMNNAERNQIIGIFANKYAKEGKTVLIITDEVEEHAKQLNEMIPKSEILIGENKKKERKEIISRFKKGETKILISTLLNEGFDFKGLHCVIMAAGKKSGKLVTQRVGRALRIESGKKEAIIVDFYDRDGGFLEKHSKERINMYEELGFEIEYV